MKTNPIRRGLPVLALAALALSPDANAAATVTHEALATTNTPVYVGFATIPGISNSDYIDQLNGNGHTWTTLSNTTAISDGGISITTVATPAGGGVKTLNDGLAQTVESGSNGQSAWSANYLIDLGSVQNIGQFNSYSWHSAIRQDQGYTLYSSADATAPNFFSGDPVGDGWTFVGSVATTYQDDTSLPHQVGVSMSGVGNARYLFVDIINGYNNGDTKYHGSFYGEFDVVVVPEPSTALIGGIGLLALLRRRRRA